MTLVITLLGAVAFFALIIASVLAHELGHLIPAKLFGVKVTQYFAGFGPTIWSRHLGETEYGFKWLPLGGFCKLIGMYPPRQPGARNTWLQRVADGARDLEYEDITPADEGRLFYQKKTWQKLIVMAGGILTNLLLAFLLFQGAFGLAGIATETTTVALVHSCMIPAARAVQTCQPGDPATPAALAGLESGDRIVLFNGVAVDDWQAMGDLIRANGTGPAAIVVERVGKRIALPTVHTVVTGLPDRLDPSRTIQAGFVGFSPVVENQLAGPVRVVKEMWGMSTKSLYALATLPVKTWNVAADVVRGRPRDVNSPMSIIGASRVAGDVASSGELRLADKVAVGAQLLGGLNLFLFWLNVIPLPPMDGGHVAGALWEALKRGAARLARRPDPGFVDTAKMLPLAYAVGGLLVVLGTVLILADVVSPVRIF